MFLRLLILNLVSLFTRECCFSKITWKLTFDDVFEMPSYKPQDLVESLRSDQTIIVYKLERVKWTLKLEEI